MRIAARGICVLLIVSGAAGVTVGGDAAIAGWWLIAVFGALLLWTLWPPGRGQDTR